MKKDFAERLLDARSSAGLTQTELGQKVGVSQRMIAAYEKRESKPRQRIAKALAKCLGVDSVWLLGGSHDLSLVEDISSVYRMKHVGCNTIMPVILRELHKKMQAGQAVDLAEAYMLLNDVQALYITLVMHDNDAYYQHIGPTLRSVLDKYELSWVLSAEALNSYCVQFLTDLKFKPLSNNLWVTSAQLPEDMRDSYTKILLKAVLEASTVSSLADLLIVEELA